MRVGLVYVCLFGFFVRFFVEFGYFLFFVDVG